MCGIVGIVGSENCAADMLLALQALQHRGQDSAGIATIAGGTFQSAHRIGLVSQGFQDVDLKSLPGQTGIGHVRYPTLGEGVLRDTQPFFYRQPGVLMAHNGNFINVHEMHRLLEDESIHLTSRCDVEPVLCVFAIELMRRRHRDHTVADAIAALEATFCQVVGAYAIVAALILDGVETVLAIRGPWGIRPVVWGRRGRCFVVASESVALDALEVTLERDVAPGEVLVLRADREPESYRLHAEQPAPCIFEYIYFARPDSIMNQQSVYEVRLALGHELAAAVRAKQITADVVIPIPDTARPAAGTVAEELHLPVREGFIKNRYTGRTFIMPNPDARRNAMRLKLNPIRSEFAGKSVLVVDDSIVRGTTLQRTIELIRDQGPKAIHLAIYSPPVLNPCYYGIDMSTREELLATHFLPVDHQGPLEGTALHELEEKLANRLGVDSLTYLPLKGLWKAHPRTRCAACFDGNYPLRLSDTQRKWIEDDRRGQCVQRELVF
jgi:amidophosphoribosyltransferase